MVDTEPKDTNLNEETVFEDAVIDLAAIQKRGMIKTKLSDKGEQARKYLRELKETEAAQDLEEKLKKEAKAREKDEEAHKEKEKVPLSVILKEKKEAYLNEKRRLKREKDIKKASRKIEKYGASVARTDNDILSDEDVKEIKEEIKEIAEIKTDAYCHDNSKKQKSESELPPIIPRAFVDFLDQFHAGGMPAPKYNKNDMNNALRRINHENAFNPDIIPCGVIMFGYDFSTLALFLSIESFRQISVDMLDRNEDFVFSALYGVYLEKRRGVYTYKALYGDEMYMRYVSEHIVAPIVEKMGTRRNFYEKATVWCDREIVKAIPELAAFKTVLCSD